MSQSIGATYQQANTLLSQNGGSSTATTIQAAAFTVAQFTGVTQIDNAYHGSNSLTGEILTDDERISESILGSVQIATSLAGAWSGINGVASLASKLKPPKPPKPTAVGEATPSVKPPATAEAPAPGKPPKPNTPTAPCRPGGGCFAAGVPLLTPDGSKPVEEFVPGDRVLSRSEFDSVADLTYKTVEEVFRRSAQILAVHVGGRAIHTTAEHPFWVEGKGWLPAGQLIAGDALISHRRERVIVSAVEDTRLWQTVYNMRIADHHTYFVGCDEWGFDVWAHNAGGVCFFETSPGKWTVLAEDGTVLAEDLAASDAQALADFYNSHPTIGPGPFAEESIPAQSSSQVFTDPERIQINQLGNENGCHSCGTSNPGTVTGNYVPDHQPPTALNVSGLPQVLYPQCLNCSKLQGWTILQQWLRKRR